MHLSVGSKDIRGLCLFLDLILLKELQWIACTVFFWESKNAYDIVV